MVLLRRDNLSQALLPHHQGRLRVHEGWLLPLGGRALGAGAFGPLLLLAAITGAWRALLRVTADRLGRPGTGRGVHL